MTTELQTAESRSAMTDRADATVPSASAPSASATDSRMLPCSRRALLQRAGVGGAALGAVGLLAACGGTGEPAAPGGDTASGGTGEASSAAGSGGGSGASVAASEVPEGTAVVVDAGGEKVVLAQPSAGQYVAFSAVCTHAGGIVQADSGTEVRCPLHGSVFDAGDGGAVTQGPATAPLPSLTVTPNGDQLVIG